MGQQHRTARERGEDQAVEVARVGRQQRLEEHVAAAAQGHRVELVSSRSASRVSTISPPARTSIPTP
jgi:hypothetical protein